MNKLNEKKLVYTLGSSNRSINEFINILKAYFISLLVDIRRFPASRFEHFKQENLIDCLAKESIDYLHLGKELGGYRSGGYENYTQSDEFKKGIKKLKKLASKQTICLMCAERFPWKCHRRFVAMALESEKNIQIVHIIEEKRVWKPNEVA